MERFNTGKTGFLELLSSWSLFQYWVNKYHSSYHYRCVNWSCHQKPAVKKMIDLKFIHKYWRKIDFPEAAYSSNILNICMVLMFCGINLPASFKALECDRTQLVMIFLLKADVPKPKCDLVVNWNLKSPVQGWW